MATNNQTKTGTQTQETARKILDTAIEIFADVGFAGARVDDIANRAGVNKATIYYHIGGKEALYAAVLHDVLSRKGAALGQLIDQALSPEEKLRRYIRELHQIIRDQPLIPAIMMREVASGGQNLPGPVIKDFTAMLQTLAAILEEGVIQGVFAPTSPFLIHLMIVLPFGVMLKLHPLLESLSRSIEAEEFIKFLDIDDAQEVEDRVIASLRP